MKAELLRDLILVDYLDPRNWPGKHKIQENKLVNVSGEPIVVDRPDFHFGTVIQIGPEVGCLKPGDKVFWRGGQMPVLEDWLLMRASQIDGRWSDSDG